MRCTGWASGAYDPYQPVQKPHLPLVVNALFSLRALSRSIQKHWLMISSLYFLYPPNSLAFLCPPLPWPGIESIELLASWLQAHLRVRPMSSRTVKPWSSSIRRILQIQWSGITISPDISFIHQRLILDSRLLRYNMSRTLIFPQIIFQIRLQNR
jgi:hypothetical protein